jgi:hypothetical protein
MLCAIKVNFESPFSLNKKIADYKTSSSLFDLVKVIYIKGNNDEISY